MNQLKILFLTMGTAMACGVVHDQITARLCLEYFTVAHPPLFRTHSPTLLALGWGALAAGQVGLALGAVLANVATSPNLPPMPWRDVLRRLARLYVWMGAGAAAAGAMGWGLARHSIVSVPSEWAPGIPVASQSWFIAVWFAHLASYALGIGGGLGILVTCWKQRGKPKALRLTPTSRAGWLRLACLAALGLAAVAWRIYPPR